MKESLIPDSPVIAGTLINKSTPKIFYKTGKNTPNKAPYLAFPCSSTILFSCYSPFCLEASPGVVPAKK